MAPGINPTSAHPLRAFVQGFAQVLERSEDEGRTLAAGAGLLRALVTQSDWLKPAYRVPGAQPFRQYLLHCDSLERFSVVSFVLGPGQSTPVHNHTVWRLVGVLWGAEVSQAYACHGETLVAEGPARRLGPGEVEAVSPRFGDIHRVANAFADRPAISIHVYGANIGAVRRSTYDAQGRPKPFVSGYANATTPNIWTAQRR